MRISTALFTALLLVAVGACSDDPEDSPDTGQDAGTDTGDSDTGVADTGRDAAADASDTGGPDADAGSGDTDTGSEDADTTGDADVGEDADPDGAGDADTDADVGPIEVPSTYTFPGLGGAGSSVSYSGQTFRHVLIDELNGYIGDMTGLIDGAQFAPAEDGDVVATLDLYFRFDSDAEGGTELFTFDLDLPTVQGTFDDISSDKDLVGKIAGNDSVTDHEDWSSAFAGWSDDTWDDLGGDVGSPEGFVIAMFEQLEENAIGHAEGDFRSGPGVTVLPVHVTESGIDLQQLVQKFLLMAVTFSQGADDYLDDDVEGKGLLASNEWDGESAYTALMHAWDEGFGYFGAARNYGEYTDDEIAGSPDDDTRDEYENGYNDWNGDDAIDLLSEYNFGASVNAAKRDRGSSSDPGTDFTQLAFDAFLEGRTIIHNAGAELTDDELAGLREARDQAVSAWEMAIAATVVHYINDTLGDMDDFGTDDYDFLGHAKHWSEMKGFALGLQFSPHSPLSDSQFDELHGYFGDAPVLEPAGTEAVADYRAALTSARALLQTAYGFETADVEGW